MASQFPCPDVLRDCDCSEFPVRNFSQEEIDQPVFFGHYNQPPNRGTWFAPGCQSICESTVSQNEADECAARQAIECSFDGAPPDGNPLPDGEFPARRFGNAQQECEAECPDETCPQTSIIAPGTVISATQADADARADSLACKRADEKLICFLTSSPLTTGNLNAFYSESIVTFGGLESPTFSIVAGALPDGLSINASTGDITGTPTVSATFNFTVQLTTSVATCTKAYSIEIAAACDSPSTDWCASPGACRVRVASFNALEWTLVWDGNLSEFGTPFPPTVPCGGFADSSGFAFVQYSVPNARWQFSILCPDDLTTYLATGPAGPSTTPPTGLYTFDPSSDPTCIGPAFFTLEAYSP